MSNPNQAIYQLIHLIYCLNINERESAVNRSIDGSTYPSKEQVPSSVCKNTQLLRNAITYTWDW